MIRFFNISLVMRESENGSKSGGLSIKRGVPQPPNLNPYIKQPLRNSTLTADQYVDGILSGDRVILSRAVTLIESSRQEHYETAQAIIERSIPYSGNSVRIGITGVPGAGKSTSIDSFGIYLLSKGHKLAVLAIDPSSERSRGSILGDKTRMERLSVEQNAFIRPSPSAGTLGGVARKTAETIILCEAAGFDYIFVETVGVGQSEIAVHSMVDFFLLIQLAGAGDELQGIKRGVMEMADGVVINKADGDNIDRAKVAEQQLRNAMRLYPIPDSGWTPEVMRYSSLYDLGIEEIWDMIDRYIVFVKGNGYFERKRNEQVKHRLHSSIDEQLRENFYNNPEVAKRLIQLEKDLLQSKKSVYSAAKEILELFQASGKR